MNILSSVQIVSSCFVKPRHAVKDSKKPMHLGPWNLAVLSVHYIQKGLLFRKPKEAHDVPDFMASFLEKLKQSLSLALVHFYPLAGRFRTLKRKNPHFYTIYVDCENSPGARFIHATLDAVVSDILSPVHVPEVVQSLFDHDRAVSHDGHTVSLLSIQVTELVDGIFVGCSMNLCIADGTSFWHFLNSWSEIHRGLEKYSGTISRPPVLQRWLPDGLELPINLPFNDPSEFVTRYESPVLVERIFHFSSKTIAHLKAKANQECKTNNEISSFQALIALVWRSITRARRLSGDRITSCKIAANNRPRMNPPLHPDYFGHSVSLLWASTTASELLSRELGKVALLLHRAIVEHTDDKIRQWHKEWLQSPKMYNLAGTFEPDSVMVGSSPKFNKYGSEFGIGKALALRSGYANKFDGKVSAYPGREGAGSIDLEVCLLPERMTALESDEEFMAATTVEYNPITL